MYSIRLTLRSHGLVTVTMMVAALSLTHAAVSAPSALSSRYHRLSDCFHVDVPLLQLFAFRATLLPPLDLWLALPFACWHTYQLAFPYTLRKVRDSNPRIVLTIAALAVRCFQPDSANLPCARLCGRQFRITFRCFTLPSRIMRLISCIG